MPIKRILEAAFLSISTIFIVANFQAKAVAQQHVEDDARAESQIIGAWRHDPLPPVRSRDYALGVAKQLKTDAVDDASFMEIMIHPSRVSLAPYCLLPADIRHRIRRLSISYIIDPAVAQEIVDLLKKCGLRIWQRSSTNAHVRDILVVYDAESSGSTKSWTEHNVLDARVVVLGVSASDYASMTKYTAAEIIERKQ